VAAAFSMAWPEGAVQDGAAVERARGVLAGFRGEPGASPGGPDALFKLADAVLCRQGGGHMLAGLSLEPECRRGHGAVNAGRVQIARLRRAPAGLPLPPANVTTGQHSCMQRNRRSCSAIGTGRPSATIRVYPPGTGTTLPVSICNESHSSRQSPVTVSPRGCGR
jgi:hypothetical protein